MRYQPLLAGVSLAAMSLVAAPDATRACTCAPVSFGDGMATADAGFRGRVLSVERAESLEGADCEPIEPRRRQTAEPSGCVEGNVRFRHRQGCSIHAAARVAVGSINERREVSVNRRGEFEICGISGPTRVFVDANPGGEVSHGTYVDVDLSSHEVVTVHPVIPPPRATQVIRMAVTEARKGVDRRFPVEVRTSFGWCQFGKVFEIGREYDVWAWERGDGELWTHGCGARDVSPGPAPHRGCAGCGATSSSPAWPPVLLALALGLAIARRRRRES